MEQSKIIDTFETYQHSTQKIQCHSTDAGNTGRTEGLKSICTATVGHLLLDLIVIYSTLLRTLPVMLLLYEH